MGPQSAGLLRRLGLKGFARSEVNALEIVRNKNEGRNHNEPRSLVNWLFILLLYFVAHRDLRA